MCWFWTWFTNDSSTSKPNWVNQVKAIEQVLTLIGFAPARTSNSSEWIKVFRLRWGPGKWKWKWSRSVLSYCSPPGSSVHGIFQARVLEWVAISFSRGSSRPRDWTRVSCIVDRCFCPLSHWGSPEPVQNHLGLGSYKTNSSMSSSLWIFEC